MAATGIRASGYLLADIPVHGGVFFDSGSFFKHIIEVGTDERPKMLGFSFVVACGANNLSIVCNN